MTSMKLRIGPLVLAVLLGSVLQSGATNPSARQSGSYLTPVTVGSSDGLAVDGTIRDIEFVNAYRQRLNIFDEPDRVLGLPTGMTSNGLIDDDEFVMGLSGSGSLETVANDSSSMLTRAPIDSGSGDYQTITECADAECTPSYLECIDNGHLDADLCRILWEACVAIKCRLGASYEESYLARVIGLPGEYSADGLTDIAFYQPGSSWATIPVVLANGDGTWTSSNHRAPTWAHQSEVVGLVGDYNGDGLTDIAFHQPGSSWATIPVVLANGDGSWRPSNHRAPTWAHQSEVVGLVGDYNGDGLTDIAFHRPGSSWATIPVVLANGDGTWTPSNHRAPTWAHQSEVVGLVGDYNGDGLTDIAFHRPGSSWATIPVVLANGDGTWTSSNHRAPTWAHQSEVVGLVGDYNGDGLTDIAFHQPGSSWATIPVVLANGDGTWTPSNHRAPTWAHQSEVVGLVGDYNGDGLTDIAFHRPGSSWATIPVVLANGDGSWRPSNHRAPTWAHQSEVVGLVGDYNGDGLTDIAFHRPGSSWTMIPIAFATGDGSWTPSNHRAPTWAHQVSVGGRYLWKNDRYVWIATDDEDTAVVFAEEGDSTTSTETVLTQFDRWVSEVRYNPTHCLGENEKNDSFGWNLATGDFDGDGYQDLAVAAPGESILGERHSGAVYLFEGAERELKPWMTLSQEGLDQDEAWDNFGNALASGDIDGDGIHDLAVGAPYEASGTRPRSGYVYIYKGSLDDGLIPWFGLDQQGLGVKDHGALFGREIVFGDFDGDGHADLAVGAPEADVSSIIASGLVFLYHGSIDGLSPWHVLGPDGLDVSEEERLFRKAFDRR